MAPRARTLSNAARGAIAAVLSAAVTGAALFALAVRRPSAPTESEAGEPPAPVPAPMPVPAPAQPTPPPQPTPPSLAPRCVVAASESFHLRPNETARSVGAEYPAGTRLVVLAPGATYRNGYLIYRVRVESGGEEGFAFLGPGELAACGR